MSTESNFYEGYSVFTVITVDEWLNVKYLTSVSKGKFCKLFDTSFDRGIRDYIDKIKH